MTKTMKKVVMVVLVAVLAMSVGLFGGVKTSSADTASVNAFKTIMDSYDGRTIVDADLVNESIQKDLIQAKAYYDKMETSERQSLDSKYIVAWEAIWNVAGPALTVHSAMASLSVYLRPNDAPKISVHKQAELTDAKLRHEALDGTNSETFADMRIAYDYSTAEDYETEFFNDLQALIGYKDTSSTEKDGKASAWGDVNDAIAAIEAIWNGVEVIGLDREDEINTATDKINAVIPADRGEITNMDRYTVAVEQLTAIKQTAKELADDIKELYGTLSTVDTQEVFYSELDKINALKKRFDELEETPENAVQTYFQTAHEEEYKMLTDMLDYCEQVANDIKEVIDLINAIGTVTYTDACKTAIDDARTAYEALDADVKNTDYIENYQTLVDAEEKYADMKEKIDAVVAKIDAIPDPVVLTNECNDLITDAENAYEQLSSEYKENVPADKYQKLLDARSDYNELLAVVQAWIDRVNAFKVDGTIEKIWAADLDEIAALYDIYDNQFDDNARAYVDAAGATQDLKDIDEKANANIKTTQDAIDALAETAPDAIVEALLDAKDMYDTLHETQQAKIVKTVLNEKWSKFQAVSYFDKAVASIKANVDAGLYFEQDAALMNTLFVLYNVLDEEAKAMVQSYNDLVAIETTLADATLINAYEYSFELAKEIEELTASMSQAKKDLQANIDALKADLAKANSTTTIAMIIGIVGVIAAAVALVFVFKK